MSTASNDERELFEAALERNSADRADFLARIGARDAALRARLERLLAAHERAQEGSSDAAPALVPAIPAELEWIGPYRLIETLGQGGMGVVYTAEQQQPVERRVALKLIRSGLDSSEVLARFEAERQALARMSHPNIAQMLDAGTTPDGRPYFVMERIDGPTITEHCDQHELSTLERLKLFLQVCDGVQHAHQKGVIHRDLKPSNVLVAEADGSPVPKVIDFGVAKALEGDLTDRTLDTELGRTIGTPAYMSPEQADSGVAAIDTRSDTYSLGVMLYELLVGALPFDQQELLAHGVGELKRILREVEPPAPSTRLAKEAEETATRSAQQRGGLSPTELARRLRRDLDWITLKALDKDPERRYPTAQALADDIVRYIRNEPVVAGAPSTWHRLSKFVRRHRLPVAIAVGGVAALVMGVAGTGMGWVLAVRAEKRLQADLLESERTEDQALAALAEAEDETDRAEAVADFLEEDVLRGVSPDELGRQVLVRDAVDSATLDVARYEDRPPVKGAIQSAIGRTYFHMGAVHQAEPHLLSALRVATETYGRADIESLHLVLDLALLYAAQGRVEEAEPLFREVLEASLIDTPTERALDLSAAQGLGQLLQGAGRPAEAEPLLAHAYEGSRAQFGERDEHTLEAQEAYAALLLEQGRAEAAEGLLRSALAAHIELSGEDHYRDLEVRWALARCLQARGAREEALTEATRAHAGFVDLFGPEHEVTLQLAALRAELGR